MNRQLEREEEALEDDLAAGRITQAEFNKELRELHRDYRAMAEDAAHEAYMQELDRW